MFIELNNKISELVRPSTFSESRQSPINRKIDGFLTKFILILVVLLTSHSASGSAKPSHDTRDIQNQISQRVKGLPMILSMRNPTIKINTIDPRLKLTRCQEPLSIEPSSTSFRSGRLTLAVRCSLPMPWKIYVPVLVQSEVSTLRLNRSLSRGSIIRQNDLQLEVSVRAPSDRPFITEPNEAIGFAVKMPLSTGTELTHAMLEPPTLIKRGEQTVIKAEGSGLNVQMTGKALEDGALGEFIRVLNLSSKRTVQGEVQLDGTIEIARW